MRCLEPDWRTMSRLCPSGVQSAHAILRRISRGVPPASGTRASVLCSCRMTASSPDRETDASRAGGMKTALRFLPQTARDYPAQHRRRRVRQFRHLDAGIALEWARTRKHLVQDHAARVDIAARVGRLRRFGQAEIQNLDTAVARE